MPTPTCIRSLERDRERAVHLTGRKSPIIWCIVLIRKERGEKQGPPLSPNMTRNRPTRCAYMVTSAHSRPDSLRVSCLWLQRLAPRRDREGVHREPRGHSYANSSLWGSVGTGLI